MHEPVRAFPRKFYMSLFWIFLGLFAAGTHVARNLYQRRLVRPLGDRPALSRDVANAARYWVGLPFAVLVLVWLLPLSPVQPQLSGRAILFAMLGGLAQIIATDMLIRLFQRRAFGIGIAYQSTDNLMSATLGPLGIAALFGLSLADDQIGVWDWLGLILATLGVIMQSFLSLDRTQRVFDWVSLLLGLGCGLAFTVTGVAYTEAVRTLGLDRETVVSALLAGVTVLVMALAFQSLLMAIWVQVRAPGQWAMIRQRGGDVVAIGLTSVLGSLALFTAFGLQHPALVSTVKNLDIPLSLLAAFILYREIPSRWEWIGITLIFASVVIIAVL